MSKQSFFNQIKKGALRGYEKHDILPSVSMAQAALESGWGKSSLATQSNNLFGIKAGSGWKGKKKSYPTKEQDGKGKVTHIDAYFRVYDSWDDSIEDHGEFFTSTPWRKTNYKDVTNATNYKTQARALQSSGYATDIKYADKLIDIIEQEGLSKYDKTTGDESMVKLMIDPGHGGHDPGAGAYGLKEKNLTLDISKRIKEYLSKNYSGVDIRMTRSNDTFVSLSNRANMANKWGADFLMSVHINAGQGSGFESYIWNGKVSQKTISVRKAIHESIISTTKKKNRGSKRANFAVLRQTTMAAILTESFFIDNKSEASNLGNSKFLDLIAMGHAEGFAKAYNLSKHKAWEKPAVSIPKKPTIKKGIETLARETIAGKHGSGDARKKSLGSKYETVQKRVNLILKGGKAKKPAKGVETLSREVIAGKHGDGDARKKSLGPRYDEVMKRVNSKLGKHKRKSTAVLVSEVNRGMHGDGDARKKSLGPDYQRVQTSINKRAGK